ncbi:MAG: CHAT domain-containing protein [Acidobacteria bacterium]|nr:CHAT domain-containing protein [Acidobacteriota bacterium]
MTANNSFSQDRKKNCLSDEDLFLYITRKGDPETLAGIEAHCADCPDCRRALAEVLGLLQTDPSRPAGEIQEPDSNEMQKTLDLIHDVAGKERSRFKFVNSRAWWPVAAALILGVASLAFWGLKDLYERNKSEDFYLQAKSLLEQQYSGTSPSNLRLDMPFNPAPMVRSTDGINSRHRAETYFYQALAVRENMGEARLGLGCIFLNESKFKDAEEAFQEVLDYRKGDVRALIGRGVARYEEALQGDDPVRYLSLLEGALEDFNEALKNDPDSLEALYNRIQVLFESGLHTEALQEIERYLSRDEESVWAEELKALRIRIKANSSNFVEEEVHRAAVARDPSRLEEIARHVPHQMPAAIWAAMRNSLAFEDAEEVPDRPNAEDLKWAAGIMESAYSRITGDHSYGKMLEYYRGLSSPRRLQKKTSDALFQSLVKLQERSDYETILRRSGPLEQEYMDLQDSWQLYNLHHLRGNCFYIRADFNSAGEEAQEMLRIARDLDSPELIARSLAAFTPVTNEQRKFTDTIRLAGELREITEAHGLDSWRSYIGSAFGYHYLKLGQYERSLREYTAALKWSCRFSDVSGITDALENTGTVMECLGRLREAKSLYDSALQKLEKRFSEKPERGNTGLNLRYSNLIYRQGELSLRSGNPDEAISFFQNCLESVGADMNELQARSRAGLVEAFLKKERNEEAAAMLDKVMDADLKQYPDTEWKTWLFRGRLLEESEDYSGALVSYEKAIGAVEGIRMDIDSANLRRSFFSERFDPYKEIIDLLYRRDGSRQMSLEYVDRAKSMTLKEYLSLPDPVYGTGANSNKIEGREDPFRIIEYFFSQDRLLVFVTGLEDRIIDTVSLELSRETIDGHVRAFIESVRENDTDDFIRFSNLLYSELVAPIERSALSGYEGPVIVLPDGPLHLLPFAGLRDSRGRYLIEKKPVVYAPSRSVLSHCLVLSRSKPAEGGRNLVLIDGTTNLPNAREEVLHLSGLYGNNARVLGVEDFAEFGKAVSRSEILHFSGHAISKQGEPVLMLQQFPRETYLDSNEISLWKLPQCSLVNLAGCSTGIGPISEGESPWGLVPAFLNAGTPAIVASLMQVDDASTKLLTRRFYELLREGTDKATALQKAQTTLLHQSSKEMKPLSWIPYILIGNPL